MATINLVLYQGFVGNDPEISENGNTKYAKFNLALNNSYTNKDGEKVDRTDWMRISIRGKLADVAEKYIKKGSCVSVQGESRSSTYTDKEGVKRYSVELEVEKLKLQDKKPTDNKE